MEKKEQTKVRFVTLFGGPEAKRKSMEEENKEYNEMMAPLFRLSERLGIETRFFSWETGLDRKTLALLRERAQDWVENEIAPQFSSDPELLSLYEEFYSSIHWDRLAGKCNDLLLENITGEEFISQVKSHLKAWGWFVWTWEHDIRAKLKARGVEEFGAREELSTLAFHERKEYQSIDALLDAILSPTFTPTSAYVRNKGVSVIPTSYQAPVNDNQMMNKFLVCNVGEDFLIPIKANKRRGLKACNILAKQTTKTEDPLIEADWYVAAAFIEIAKQNPASNGVSSVPTVTMRELVAFISGARLDNVTPANSFYKFVESSLYRLKNNRFDYSYLDIYAKNRAEIKEDFIASRDNASLLDFDTGTITKRHGGAVERALFFKSSFAFEILELLGLRNTIPMNSAYIPPKLTGEDQIAAFFDMFLRALNHGKGEDKVNAVYLYGKDHPRKKTLFKTMAPYGWIDITTLGRTPTKDERNKDAAQIRVVKKILDHWAKNCPNISVSRNDKDPNANGESEGAKRKKKLEFYWAKFDRDAKKPTAITTRRAKESAKKNEPAKK